MKSLWAQIQSVTTLLLIALTAMGLFLPVAAEAKSSCYQPQLVSFYKTDSGDLKQQEFVGTTIRWIPNNRNYVLTVAHGVVNADRVVGICDGKKVEMKIIGIDTDRDTALLEPLSSDVNLEPFFKLPQGDHDIAQRQALSRLKDANHSTIPRAQLPFPFKNMGQDESLKHLAIMHPFFTSSDLAKKQFEVATLNWKPLIRKDVGIFEFQENEMIAQFVVKQKYSIPLLQNPFASFDPLYLTAGVRPGMSGSPVFEYLDRDLSAFNNLFTGMVSKTQGFKKMTLLIPRSIVEIAITDILANAKAPTEHMGYTYNKKSGRQRPYFSSQALGLTFVNSCDSDFANTSDLQTSRGGDWGDGGGSPKDATHYIFSPFFTDSRYVPPMTCERAGITDNKGTTYIAYKYKEKLLPLRNLDQFMTFKRTFDKDADHLRLVRQNDWSKYKKDLCAQYTKLKPRSFNTALIRQFDENTVRDASDGITIPRGVTFRAMHFDSPVTTLECDQNEDMHVVLSGRSSSLFSLKIDDQGDASTLTATVGHCAFTAIGKNFGFEKIFKHANAEIKMFYEEPQTWVFHIGQISEACGISSITKPAIRVEVDVDVSPPGPMDWRLIEPF